MTGVGAVTPMGVGARVFAERWRAGDVVVRDGLSLCEDFDPAEHLSAKEIRRTDRFAQLALVAAREALAEAGWSESHLSHSDRVACIVGTGAGGLQSVEDEIDLLRTKGPDSVSPLGFTRFMANAAAATIAIKFGMYGETYGLVGACAAGTQAVGSGCRLIHAGEADAVLVGGTEARPTSWWKAGFELLEALSSVGISRPFDRDRDGFIPGEGAAMMCLESRESAERRGATVLGEVIGYGSSSDGHHLTAPDPTGTGAARAMQRALSSAELMPADVDYINAHGTSTQANDRAETLAIKTVFGEAARDVAVSSTKSVVGHLQGAAGTAEAIATLLLMEQGVAGPTMGLEHPDEGMDLNYVPQQAQPLPRSGTGRPLVALSNSFGFGGHNATVALGSI